MLKKNTILLFCIFGMINVCFAEPPAEQIDTAEALLLYEASRSGVLTTSLNIEALWDTVITVADSSWGKSEIINSFIDKTNYTLRGLLIYTDLDAIVRFYGAGIDCKYGADSTNGLFLWGDEQKLLLFSDTAPIDSIRFFGTEDTSVVIQLSVLAGKPK